VQQSNVSGTALREACCINKSLFILSNVVKSLEKNTNFNINYRDSKLTMLLKDSLGGNCETILIGCVSPS